MSFALQPSDGHARLLNPVPEHATSDQQSATSQIQGAVHAAQAHASDIQKQTSILAAIRNGEARHSITQQVKRSACEGAEALRVARRLLTELEMSGDGSASRDKLQGLKLQKLCESIGATAVDINKQLTDFKGVESSWQKRQASAAAAVIQEGSNVMATEGDLRDLESGPSNLQQQVQQKSEVVSQAEVDMHATIANEYARDIMRVATEVHLVHGLMKELAEHVQTQGQELDTIEGNLTQVERCTEEGVGELQITAETQQKRIKCNMVLLFAALLLSGFAIASVWR